MAGDVTEDILFSPVRDQASRLRNGTLSPVALAEAYLDRLEKIGPKLGAVVTVMRDSGMKEARAAEAEIKAGKYRGLLHGIPYGVKDLLATKGVPTTWGAAPYKDQVFDYDAAVVERLRAAGAVLIGKLAMVELAGGFGYQQADASFTGPGRTPWDRDHWSGGSSTGPAAAVAAGLVSFAIGSETSGSIITPSTYCGVAGLRPTYGRVSRAGAMALCWSLDKLGPMARSADCCGIVLKAIAGADPRDPTSVERPFEHPDEPPVPGRLRLGLIKGALAGLQPAVRKNFEEALKILRGFAEVDEKEVDLPDLPIGPAIVTIIDVEGASAFEELIDSGRTKELQDETDKTGGYAATLIPAVDYLRAQRLRVKLKKAMDELYAPYDALVCPSLATVSPPVDKSFRSAYPGFGSPSTAVIPANNLVGQPAVAVPMGFGEKGLPTGLSFTGRIWSEQKLLTLARLYQRATDWHKKRPPLKDLG